MVNTSPVTPVEQQTMGAVKDAAIVGNAMGTILQPALEASIEPILMQLAPKVGEMATEKMIEKYSRVPGLAQVPNLADEVTKAVSTIMMSFKPELIEYCGDVVRFDIAKGFEHVMLDFMRALQYGTMEAEEIVWSLMPGFAGSFLRTARTIHSEMSHSTPCDCGIGFPTVCEEVFSHVFGLMKDFLKAELKLRNIPSELAELLPWDGCDWLKHHSMDALEGKLPAPKSGKKHYPNFTNNDNPFVSDAADEYDDRNDGPEMYPSDYGNANSGGSA